MFVFVVVVATYRTVTAHLIRSDQLGFINRKETSPDIFSIQFSCNNGPTGILPPSFLSLSLLVQVKKISLVTIDAVMDAKEPSSLYYYY